MPYQRKRRYTRKPYKKAKGAKLNTRQKKEVKLILAKNMELKSFDNIGSASPDTAGVIAKWFSIPQGSGNAQRIGNDITGTHIELRYDITLSDSYNKVRVIIFQWALDDGVDVPTVPDILYLGTGNYFNALYSFDNRDKFKILHDRRYLLEATSVGTTSTPLSSPTYKLKIPHKQLKFNGAGATTGRFMIYQLTISDSVAVPHPSVNTNVRLVYRDA